MDTAKENFRFTIFKGNREMILSRIFHCSTVQINILFPLYGDDHIIYLGFIDNNAIFQKEIQNRLSAYSDNENEIYLFQLDRFFGLFNPLSALYTLLKIRFIPCSTEDAELVTKIIKKLYRLFTNSENRATQHLYITILLHHFNEILLRSEVFKKRNILIARGFIKILGSEFYPEHQVCYYAERLFVSRRYLTKVVHEVLKETPKLLIDRQIISLAKKLLATSLAINEISDQLKFENPSSFTTFFKKRTGYSPSQYRNSLLNS